MFRCLCHHSYLKRI